MPRFTRRPLTITAVQITDATFNNPLPNPEHIRGIAYDPIMRTVSIPTPEGKMRGIIGDWIITGIKGEHYPCKDDIFQATYMPSTVEIVADKLPFNMVIMIATVLALRARGPTHLNALMRSYTSIDNDMEAFYSMMIMLYDRGFAVIDDKFIVSYVVPEAGSVQEKVMAEFEAMVPPGVLAAMS